MHYANKPHNRDVEIIEMDKDLCLVISCDSAGGIGEKKMDVVKAPVDVVGMFTSRVALMELISVGAMPSALSVTICAEPFPTAEKILEGIKRELESVGMDLPIVISTEKNFHCCQTGLGVTAIGIVKKENLRINKTEKGDKVYCIGIPRVGDEVLLNRDIVDLKLIMELVNYPYVHDILPVGSKGIRVEAEMLSSFLSLKMKWRENLKMDLDKSAGPSTCVIVTSREDLYLESYIPINLLGTVE